MEYFSVCFSPTFPSDSLQTSFLGRSLFPSLQNPDPKDCRCVVTLCTDRFQVVHRGHPGGRGAQLAQQRPPLLILILPPIQPVQYEAVQEHRSGDERFCRFGFLLRMLSSTLSGSPALSRSHSLMQIPQDYEETTKELCTTAVQQKLTAHFSNWETGTYVNIFHHLTHSAGDRQRSPVSSFCSLLLHTDRLSLFHCIDFS